MVGFDGNGDPFVILCEERLPDYSGKCNLQAVYSKETQTAKYLITESASVEDVCKALTEQGIAGSPVSEEIYSSVSEYTLSNVPGLFACMMQIFTGEWQ